MNNDHLEAVIDEHIRPFLSADGGDMKVISFEDGIVRFRLTGHCEGCPAADYTAEQFINTELTQRVEGVKKAVLVTVTSQELIDQARELLKLRAAG